MKVQRRIATAILTAILTAKSGLCSERVFQEGAPDEISAQELLITIIPQGLSVELREILGADSLDSLSQTQKDKLSEIIKRGAEVFQTAGGVQL